MQRIALSRGNFEGLYALVDDEDYSRLVLFKWSAAKMATGWVARRNDGGMHVYMHREIMFTPENMVCDHIHHNTLDNRKSELRNCTHLQNTYNFRKYKTKRKPSSQYKGVSWHKAASKWQVKICVDRKEKYVGLFVSEIDAARAYDVVAIEYHGEFASLNFPENVEESAGDLLIG